MYHFEPASLVVAITVTLALVGTAGALGWQVRYAEAKAPNRSRQK